MPPFNVELDDQNYCNYKSIYNFLDVNDKLTVEQKGCRKKSSGTKVQLLIDKTILCDCRKRHVNLGMAWVDYKKAHDMDPHSWLSKLLTIILIVLSIL